MTRPTGAIYDQSITCTDLIVTDDFTLTDDMSIGGDLTVTGAASLSSTLEVTGAASLSSTLEVTGATTLSNNLVLTNATETLRAAFVNEEVGDSFGLIDGGRSDAAAAVRIVMDHGTVDTYGLLKIQTRNASGLNLAVVIDEDSNFKIGQVDALSGTAPVGQLAVKNGTIPDAVTADTVIIGAKDVTSGTTLSALSLYQEEPPVVIGTFTPSHKVPVWINGVEYHIQLDAV